MKRSPAVIRADDDDQQQRDDEAEVATGGAAQEALHDVARLLGWAGCVDAVAR